MRIVLRQEFPLGRFHATLWRVNPFDDPHGEWPPSPWRLVRAVTARWYQWVRELGMEPDLAQLEKLQGALCRSTYAFHLPPDARKGTPLRQYHPTEFGWRPAEKKKAGTRSYATSLVQDNYWSVSPESPVWWFIDGDDWTDELHEVLAQCLARMTYFGRTETLTRIRVAHSDEVIPDPNCHLVAKRTKDAVPVLSPLRDATRDDIERTTDSPQAKRTVPPGAQWLYAVRPMRPAARERRRVPEHRPDCHLMQFAIGWHVEPELRAIVRLTSRFRGAVLRELLRLKTNGASGNWAKVSSTVREAVADMFGKDANGDALKGPRRHTEFLVWCEDGHPTRLLVWRGSRAFDADEQEAIQLAAMRDISWAAAGSDADEWKVRLVPLDLAVPPPPGFDSQSSKAWESVTPYVPPRHYLRHGKERECESLVEQIRRELVLRGIEQNVDVELVGPPQWVAVHVPRREAKRRAFIGDRHGQMVRLHFATPLAGPIRLGHSSTFGLGLFRPVQEDTSLDFRSGCRAQGEFHQGRIR